MLISYAQNFEDVMLWRALGHVSEGFYIDIGAQDPVIDSVSLAFHEKGWRGIHVEPTVHYATLLRRQRPGDTVIQAAVGDTPGVLPLFEIPGTGISTLDPDIAAQHRERGFEVSETTTPIVTLSSVLALPEGRDVHWMKIDVEGFERQVLASWGESAVRPWVVVVESTLPLTQIQSHDAWEGLLLSKGYAFVYFDGLNRYYVAEAQSTLRQAFSVPPNVFDGFVLNGTASASFHHLIKQRFESQLGDLSHRLADAQSLGAAAQRDREAATEQLRRHHEREQALQSQLEAARAERARTEHEAAQREAELSDQLSKAAEALLIQATARADAQAEHEAQAVTQQVVDAHREQQASQLQARAERERSLREALQFAEQAVHRQEQDHAQREQELAAQLFALQQQVQQERDALALAHRTHLEAEERAHAERERMLRDALHATRQGVLQQEQARHDRDALTHAHREQQDAQAHAHAERESALREALQAAQRELLQREQARAEREQEVAAQLAALRERAQQEREALLQARTEREREVADQLLVLQQESAQRVTSLEAQHASALQAWVDANLDREKSLILLAKNLETELRERLASEQIAVAQLRTALERARHELAGTRSSWSWRLTSPLRKLVAVAGRGASGNTATEPVSDGGLAVDSESRNPLGTSVAGDASVSPSRGDISTAHGQQLRTATDADGSLLSASGSNNLSLSRVVSMNEQPMATRPAHSVERLLSLYDEDFVRCAYQTILGRDPDRSGLENYLRQVRRGIAKQQIVAELALSPEGKRCSIDVPGLREAIAVYAKRRPSILARLYRRVTSDSYESIARILDNRLFALEQRITQQSTQITELLDWLKRDPQQDARETFPLADDYRARDAAQSASLPPHTFRVAELYSELKTAIAAKSKKSD